MKNSIRFSVSFTLFFTFFINSLPSVKACGPFLIEPLFNLKQHADFPLSEYTNGKVGIVPASFGPMSLFVFYRQLNNLPLTKTEQKQIVNAMENQIFFRAGIYDKSGSDGSVQESQPDYFEKWAAARAKVTNEKRDIETDKRIANEYNSFSNCLPDAFINAAKTLEARLAKYGNNENVKEWLKGQDKVFSNCESTQGQPEILGDNFPEWLRQDREYQIAATQFYNSDYGQARATFEKITAEENSVWKNTAKFVAARTFIREASFINIPDEASSKAKAEADKKELLQKAADKLQNILADASMNDYHKSAFRLLGLVKYRMMPAERQNELAELLSRPAEDQNIYNDLTDYTLLLDHSATLAYDKGTEIDRLEAEKAGQKYDYDYNLKLRDLPLTERSLELSDWLFTYKAEDGFAHAYEKWKETGKTDWFVAAIAKTDPKAPQTAEILSAADQIQTNSAAFQTVRYHQIRLLTATGKRAEAINKLSDVFDNNFNALPLSSQNKYYSQRMILAQNLDDFLQFAQRKAVIFDWDETGREEGTSVNDDKFLSAWENRTMFDSDAVAFLNEKVPLSVLRQAALSQKLPDHLKRFLVIAVWTRAFELGNQAIEREFAPLMLRFAREFSPFMSKYASAKTPSGREAAALISVLRLPVLQPYVPVGFGREGSQSTEIDSIRGNWWCAEDVSDKGDESYNHYGFKYPQEYPAFLNEAERSAADREHQQLIAHGNSATYLTKRAVEFANLNPKNPQTPEILHLAVRSTRYGCKDAETGKYSKEAFDILHKRYPNSAWTKETPYWFGQ